jgi:hypothetical protein
MIPVNRAVTSKFGGWIENCNDMMGYFGGNPRQPLAIK